MYTYTGRDKTYGGHHLQLCLLRLTSIDTFLQKAFRVLEGEGHVT